MLMRDPPLRHPQAHVTGDFADWMMAEDSRTYLPGDILVKVDRAAMAASLETRAPFLDPRVVEAAWSLDPNDRSASGTGKVALRHILVRHVPRELTERPKQGFAVPLDAWLRGPLAERVGHLSANKSLIEQAGLDEQSIRKLRDDHAGGGLSGAPILWSVVQLLGWLETWQTDLRPPPLER